MLGGRPDALFFAGKDGCTVPMSTVFKKLYPKEPMRRELKVNIDGERTLEVTQWDKDVAALYGQIAPKSVLSARDVENMVVIMRTTEAVLVCGRPQTSTDGLPTTQLDHLLWDTHGLSRNDEGPLIIDVLQLHAKHRQVTKGTSCDVFCWAVLVSGEQR